MRRTAIGTVAVVLMGCVAANGTAQATRVDHAAVGATAAAGVDLIWDACRTVNLKTNLQGVPATEERLVLRAARSIARVSGLRIIDAGSTDLVPLKPPRRVLGVQEPQTVFFAIQPVSTSELGFGGFESENIGDVTGGVHISFKTVRGMAPARNQRLKLYMHELAHAFGVPHVRVNRNNIMRSVLGNSTATPRWTTREADMLRAIGQHEKPCGPKGPLPILPVQGEDMVKVEFVDGQLLLSWRHNPDGYTDPAGGSRETVQGYRIFLRDTQSTVDTMVSPGTGWRTHTANLGPYPPDWGFYATVVPITSAPMTDAYIDEFGLMGFRNRPDPWS